MPKEMRGDYSFPALSSGICQIDGSKILTVIPHSTGFLRNNGSGTFTWVSQIDLTSQVTGILPSGNLPSNVVYTDTTQTISGQKTFTSNIVIGSNGAYFGKSGDNNSIHVNVANNASGLLPFSTVTSNNASLGLATYRWRNVFTGGVDSTGPVVVSSTQSVHLSMYNAVNTVSQTSSQTAIRFRFNTATLSDIEYAGIGATIFSNGDTTYDGQLNFHIATAGVLTNIMYLRPTGLVPRVTNTYDLGSSSLNWSTIYSNNVTISGLFRDTSFLGSRALVSDGSGNIVESSVTSTQLAFVVGLNQSVSTTSDVQFNSQKFSDYVGVGSSSNTNWLLIATHASTSSGTSQRYHVTLYGGDWADCGIAEFVFDSFSSTSSSTTYTIRRRYASWRHANNEFYSNIEWKVFRNDTTNNFEIYVRGLTVDFFGLTAMVRRTTGSGLTETYTASSATVPTTGYTEMTVTVGDIPTRQLADSLYVRNNTLARGTSFDYTDLTQVAYLEYTGTVLRPSHKFQTIASTVDASSLRIPTGTAPTSPAEGDIWYTTPYLFLRNSGGTRYITITAGMSTNRLARAAGPGIYVDSLISDDGTNIDQVSGYYRVTNPLTTDYSFVSRVGAESSSRFAVRQDGRLEFGGGSAARDSFIDRVGVNALKTYGSFEANSFVKTGGTSSQFLKADGSVDSTTYLSGNGVVNFVPKYGTVNQLTPSIITDDGTTVNIGNGTVTSPRLAITHNTGIAGGSEVIVNAAGGASDSNSGKYYWGTIFRFIGTTEPHLKLQRNNSGTWNTIFQTTSTTNTNLDLTFNGSITLSPLTGSRALVSSAGKVISESSVTSTELGYVSGVTSSIQTQLNSRLTLTSTLTGYVVGSGLQLSSSNSVLGAFQELQGQINNVVQGRTNYQVVSNENTGNQWVKLLTSTINNAFTYFYCDFSIVGGYNGRLSAEGSVLVSAGTGGTIAASNPRIYIKSSNGLDPANFKLIITSDFPSAKTVEVWYNCPSNFTALSFSFSNVLQHTGTFTPNSSPAWAASPTAGTQISASYDLRSNTALVGTLDVGSASGAWIRDSSSSLYMGYGSDKNEYRFYSYGNNAGVVSATSGPYVAAFQVSTSGIVGEAKVIGTRFTVDLLAGTGTRPLVTSPEGYVSAQDAATFRTTIGAISGNQTITLSGVITGSGTTAITTAIADGALSIAKTSGLQTALDGKVAKSGDTMTGDLTISKTSPKIILNDTNNTTGSYASIQFDSTANQGVSLTYNEIDGELPIAGYGLILGASPNNTQFPSTGTLSLSVLGEIYSGATTVGGLSRVLNQSNFQTLYPDLYAVEVLAGTTGLLRKTAANTWSLDTTSYQTDLGYTPVNKAGDTGVGSISGSNGSRLVFSVDNTPIASANALYNNAPLTVQRVATSGTTSAAGVGFHNNGTNAAFLYYDPATGIFKYNRNNGDIVTFWDTSNLPFTVTGSHTIGTSYNLRSTGYPSVSGLSGPGIEVHYNPATTAGRVLAYDRTAAARIKLQLDGSPIEFWANNVLKGSFDASGNFNLVNLTASRVVVTDASKNLVSSSVTSTELSYVSGVTSAIQTQLNGKQNTLTNPITGTGTAGIVPVFNGTTTLTNSSISDNGSYVTAYGYNRIAGNMDPASFTPPDAEGNWIGWNRNAGTRYFTLMSVQFSGNAGDAGFDFRHRKSTTETSLMTLTPSALSVAVNTSVNGNITSISSSTNPGIMIFAQASSLASGQSNAIFVGKAQAGLQSGGIVWVQGATDAQSFLSVESYSQSSPVYIRGTTVNAPNLILSSQTLTNFTGATRPTFYVGQTMATNDYWQIYGEGSVANSGSMVFETGDDASEPFIWRMRNTGASQSFDRMTLSSTAFTVNVNVNIPGLTASRVVTTDGSKNLTSSSVSLTELGYLTGVTSNIQTQINGKMDIPFISANTVPQWNGTAFISNGLAIIGSVFAIGSYRNIVSTAGLGTFSGLSFTDQYSCYDGINRSGTSNLFSFLQTVPSSDSTDQYGGYEFIRHRIGVGDTQLMRLTPSGHTLNMATRMPKISFMSAGIQTLTATGTCSTNTQILVLNSTTAFNATLPAATAGTVIFVIATSNTPNAGHTIFPATSETISFTDYSGNEFVCGDSSSPTHRFKVTMGFYILACGITGEWVASSVGK